MPLHQSRRQQVLAAIRERLQAITVANGYATDAGLHIHHGGEVTAHDEMPVLIYRPEPAVLVAEGRQEQWRVTVMVTGLAISEGEDPLDAAEALLADIKQALFTPTDRTLGGVAIDVAPASGADTFDREPGGSFVGCIVPALVEFIETRGEPHV
jgi:hypothetical protein